jgi:DNA-binding response OmpR family regulator
MMLNSPEILIAGTPHETQSILFALTSIQGQCMGSFNLNHALAQAREFMPRIVVIDVSQWKEGWNLVQQIRSIPEYKPQILIMSYGLTQKERKLTQEYAINRWVIKPFNSTSVLHELKSILSGEEYRNPGSIDVAHLRPRPDIAGEASGVSAPKPTKLEQPSAGGSHPIAAAN